MELKDRKKRLKAIIKEMGEFILYKDEIVKSATFFVNGIQFKLPTANSDWCIDLFKVITYMTLNYQVYISGEATEPNVILLVNTITML